MTEKELRIQKLTKIFSENREKLKQAGLTFGDSCEICDLVLSLPIEKIPIRIKYKGVYKRTGRDRYYSKIIKDKKFIYIGAFKYPKKAALAFDKKCYELYRDLSKLNFPKLIKEKCDAIM